MANETEWTYASQVTLEASGASAASDAFVAADDATLSSTNHSDYPVADFVLKCDLGGAPSNATVNLYRCDQNIDGTNDAVAPSSSFPHVLVGVVAIPASTAAYYPFPNVPLSQECKFYLENKTGQTLSAGWTLKATPKTYVPGS